MVVLFFFVATKAQREGGQQRRETEKKRKKRKRTEQKGLGQIQANSQKMDRWCARVTDISPHLDRLDAFGGRSSQPAVGNRVQNVGYQRVGRR